MLRVWHDMSIMVSLDFAKGIALNNLFLFCSYLEQYGEQGVKINYAQNLNAYFFPTNYRRNLHKHYIDSSLLAIFVVVVVGIVLFICRKLVFCLFVLNDKFVYLPKIRYMLLSIPTRQYWLPEGPNPKINRRFSHVAWQISPCSRSILL